MNRKNYQKAYKAAEKIQNGLIYALTLDGDEGKEAEQYRAVDQAYWDIDTLKYAIDALREELKAHAPKGWKPPK